MNLNESITEALADNVAQITIGMNEKKQIWALALQLVETGAQDQMEIKHAATGASVVDCITQLRKQIEHSNKIRSLILTRPKK